MPKLSALEYALKLLGYRARSERELRERLADKKYQPDDITAALEKLRKIKLVDDETFAVNYVRDKLAISRRGPRRIYFELIKHGVTKEIAERATKTVVAADELATATALIQSRSRQWAKLAPPARYRRAIGLLSRRGFSPGVIRDVLRDWPRYASLED